VISQALGDTDLRLSTLGLGSWALGAGKGGSSGLGPQDDRDSVATVHRALEVGVNWIDTAASYGIGHAERVMARALRGVSERPYVFTKCGTVYDAEGRERHHLKAASIRAEIDGSLNRLEVDALDLVYIHQPFPPEDLEEAWATLADLEGAGKIRHLGASNFSAGQLDAVAAIAPVAALQVKYSLVERRAEAEVLPYCEERGIGALVYSTLHHGLLAGTMTAERVAQLPASDFRRTHRDFTEPRLSAHAALVAALGAIADRRGCSRSEVAIAWALRNGAVVGAIVGCRRPEQVDAVVGAVDLRLTESELEELERLSGAPTPG